MSLSGRHRCDEPDRRWSLLAEYFGGVLQEWPELKCALVADHALREVGRLQKMIMLQMAMKFR